MAPDPVCGMKVSRKAAPATSEYRGVTWAFCSAACREEFDRNPDRYVPRSGNRKEKHPKEDNHQ
jgi:Cu+-exporting ATPase